MRLIRRQHVKNVEVGNIVKIGDKFRIVQNIIKIPLTNQGYVFYRGDRKRNYNRVTEVAEFNLNDFILRQRQTER